MNERLIELYLEGWKNGYWTSDFKGRMENDVPREWALEVYEQERPLEEEWNNELSFLNHSDEYWKRKECREYKEAARRWRKLKMSKLWQSLK